MKTFFVVLGIIFLVLILVALGALGFGLVATRENPLDTFGFWFFSMRGGILNNESKAYADAAIPAIVSTWSEKELLDRESPEFRQSATQAQLDQMFQRISALGHLQKCEPAVGQSIMSPPTRTIGAEYTAKATFEKGEAVVALSLIKHGDQWQILRFVVNSPALQSPQQQQQQQQQTPPQQH